MSMRYAEVTIIKNLKKEYLDHYFGRLCGQEIKVTDEDNIVIQFEDGSLFDTLDFDEDDLSLDDYSSHSENSSINDNDTDLISYNNSNTESKHCEHDNDSNTEVASYKDENSSEYKCKSIIRLGPRHYDPLCLSHFIVNNVLFQYKIPCGLSSIFSTTHTISYKNLFKNNSSGTDIRSEKKYQIQASIYNMIYHRPIFTPYYDTIDSFGIAKIESNHLKPRFIVAYEDKYFTRRDIIYLVDHIFKFKY